MLTIDINPDRVRDRIEDLIGNKPRFGDGEGSSVVWFNVENVGRCNAFVSPDTLVRLSSESGAINYAWKLPTGVAKTETGSVASLNLLLRGLEAEVADASRDNKN